MKKLFWAFVVLALVTSCTYSNSNLVNKTYDDISQKIIKGTSTKGSVLKEFGAPTTKARTASGYEQWAYYSEQKKMVLVPSGPAWVKTTLDVVFGKDGTVKAFSFGEIRSYQ